MNGGKGVLLLATEVGYKYLDNTDIAIVDILKWEDMFEVGKYLHANPKKHELLVIDTIDRLWRKCEDYAVKKLDAKAKEDIEHVSDAGYGKGPSRVKEEFDKVINGLNQMGYPLVFLSHSKVSKKDGIDRTGTSLSPSAENIVAGLCDFVFYLHQVEGKRRIRTKPHPMFLAGDRSGRLPELMELSFKKVQEALSGNTSRSVSKSQ